MGTLRKCLLVTGLLIMCGLGVRTVFGLPQCNQKKKANEMDCRQIAGLTIKECREENTEGPCESGDHFDFAKDRFKDCVTSTEQTDYCVKSDLVCGDRYTCEWIFVFGSGGFVCSPDSPLLDEEGEPVQVFVQAANNPSCSVGG